MRIYVYLTVWAWTSLHEWIYLLHLGRDLWIYYINKAICDINGNICINFSYILTAAIATWYFRLIGLGCIRCKISIQSLIHVKKVSQKSYFTYFSLYINVCSLLYTCILNNYDTNSSYGLAFNCTFFQLSPSD
jgi:hypothetical protein